MYKVTFGYYDDGAHSMETDDRFYADELFQDGCRECDWCQMFYNGKLIEDYDRYGLV